METTRPVKARPRKEESTVASTFLPHPNPTNLILRDVEDQPHLVQVGQREQGRTGRNGLSGVHAAGGNGSGKGGDEGQLGQLGVYQGQSGLGLMQLRLGQRDFLRRRTDLQFRQSRAGRLHRGLGGPVAGLRRVDRGDEGQRALPGGEQNLQVAVGSFQFGLCGLQRSPRRAGPGVVRAVSAFRCPQFGLCPFHLLLGESDPGPRLGDLEVQFLGASEEPVPGILQRFSGLISLSASAWASAARAAAISAGRARRPAPGPGSPALRRRLPLPLPAGPSTARRQPHQHLSYGDRISLVHQNLCHAPPDLRGNADLCPLNKAGG